MGASGIPFAIWLLERIAVGEALMLQLLVLHGGLLGSPDIPAAAAVRIVFSMSVGRSFQCGCSSSIWLRCMTSMSLKTRTVLACQVFCLLPFV